MDKDCVEGGPKLWNYCRACYGRNFISNRNFWIFDRVFGRSVIASASAGRRNQSIWMAINSDCDHGVFALPDPAEDFSDAFHPSIFLSEQLVPVFGLGGSEDAGFGVNPFAFHIAAHVARRNADARVVAHALHLPRVGQLVDVKNAVLFG